jgi:hypothetical protein
MITLGSIYTWMKELGTKLSGTVNMRVTVPPRSATWQDGASLGIMTLDYSRETKPGLRPN